MNNKTVMILGAGGRVGMQISAELQRKACNLVLVDLLPQALLEQAAGRLQMDSQLASGQSSQGVRIYGGIDALDVGRITDILAQERPDLVINYAIPITWDATKRLGNYSAISAAGLGAFTPIQVLTPLKITEAIRASGVDTRYMVGNLPDITVPIINAIADDTGIQKALCGAGNVGLNQIALRLYTAQTLAVAMEQVDVSLVSHHLHWVAPREPGYSNEGPFLAQIRVGGEDVTDHFDDLRQHMNAAVQCCYEANASFSSTTGILASRVAQALLDSSDHLYSLHTPAPNGLPGGYPVTIQRGEISVNLPEDWLLADAITAMEHCHTLDGVQKIHTDGTVEFTDIACTIVQKELGFKLPAKMPASDIDAVAQAQIETLRARFG